MALSKGGDIRVLQEMRTYSSTRIFTSFEGSNTQAASEPTRSMRDTSIGQSPKSFAKMKGGWMIADRWQSVIIFQPFSRPPESAVILSGDSLAGATRAIVSARRETMKRYGTHDIDNRDSEQVYYYMEARIEALKQRIQELESEKKTLQANHSRTQVA